MDIKMQQAINELKAAGIEPVNVMNNKNTEIYQREMQLISDMARINGIEYSQEQKEVLTTHGNMAIIACAGSGKALRNGTNILTKNGYTPIEKLKVGDKILTYDGKEQTVIGVYPQGKKKIYRVYFLDEVYKDCCIEHLWEFKNSLNSEWRVENTESLIKRLNNNEIISLPNVSNEIINNNKVLPISLSEFSTIYIEEINECINKNNKSEFIKKLETLLNVDYSKNIESILNSIIKSFGNDTISNIKTLKMAKIIRNICQLNSNYRVIREENGIYNLIKPENIPEISNKYLKDIDNEESELYTKYRLITHIEELEEEDEMTCIKVSDPSCLYVTEDYIVTHNTTVLTNLIVKRILTGEIRDYRRMICTTYSNGGATEMEDRLNALLNRFNITTNANNKVRVYTLHAFFLHILRTFGVDKNVCKEGQRTRFIAEAAKEAKMELRDNDLDDLSNLLSYQTNGLLTDEQALNSEANTFDSLDPQTYYNIRIGFAKKKSAANVMDFDDMQTFLYAWLCKYKNSTNPIELATYKNVRNYCRSLYDDFYIDEAQDVSKIQFEIIKSLITIETDESKLDKNLVLVGDDDQCLIKGTVIKTIKGYKNIEKIRTGDKVLSLHNGKLVVRKVVEVLRHFKEINTQFIKITTESGKVIECTADHKLMVKIDKDKFNSNVVVYNNNKWIIPTTNLSIKNNTKVDLNTLTDKLRLDKNYPHFGTNVKTENGYTVIRANSAHIGMTVGVVNQDESIIEEKIIKLESYKSTKPYTEVYDLNIEEDHNFIANNIIVHNCIYKWRGADPSIILNIGSTFDMHIKMLSTNYRCKSHIVDFAKRSIKFNKNRYEKSIQAYEEGGKVEVEVCDNTDLTVMSEKAVNKIKELLDRGEHESDICVMARNNLHLAILSNMLFEQGIYCEYPASMKLTNTSMYKDIKDILNIANGCNDSDITKRMLWKLVRYMSIKKSDLFTTLQNSCNMSLKDALGFILLKTNTLLDIDSEQYKNINLPPLMIDNLCRMFNQLYAETKDNLSVLYQVLNKPNINSRFLGLCTMYLNSAGEIIYKRADKNRTIKGVCNYFYRLLKNRGIENTLELLRLTEQYEHGAEYTLGDKVTLTTIHSAKGKEWKNVIAFACDVFSMPSAENIQRLSDNGASRQELQEYIDEERRLYYVEITRGKEYVYVITNELISYFLIESCNKEEDLDLNDYIIGQCSVDSYINGNSAEQLNKKQAIILDKIKQK